MPLRRKENKRKTAYGIGDAKAHLSDIVDRVEASGEEIVLTRHGKPVARIIPERSQGPRKLGALRDEIKLLPGWDKPLTYEDMFSE